jgi:calcineurin-like phosphoesterase family protein
MNNNIYFTSDTHYFHRNIVRGTTSWEQFQEGSSHQSTRDFDTIEEHNDALVNNINGMVKENDTLYHLGDWSFGGADKIKEFRDRLQCKNIHLILGNHDQHIEKVSSIYRELFSSVNHVIEISMKIDSMKSGMYGKTRFFMSHYSHQVWNQSHHGTIHLFGHSHGSLKGIGRSMDIGVDTNNMYPYHLDEILDVMKGIPIHILDHHTQNTN